MGTIFRHPRIFTGRDLRRIDARSFSRQLAVDENGLIASPTSAGWDVVDLPGTVVVPGFIDTHAHLSSLGGGPSDLGIRDVCSREELLAKAGEAARELADNAWITGSGWQDVDWPERTLPTADELEEVAGGHPVALFRRDRHALIASRSTLVAAGIDNYTPDPRGGLIQRDPRTGRPTGLLIDMALELVAGMIPRPSPEAIAEEVLERMKHLTALGITCVHDGLVEKGLWNGLLRLVNEDRSLLRVRAMLGLDWDQCPPDPESLWLRVFAVKGFADGALGSHGAQLSAPYADAATTGIAVQSDEELEERAQLAIGNGLQLAVHSIGDAGARRVLDLIERHRESGAIGCNSRWRLEHAQILHPDDMQRLQGICLATQPIHWLADGPWAEDRVGPERLAWCYRARSVVEAGAIVGFGSDYPIEGADPRTAIDLLEAPCHPAVPGWSRDDERLDRCDSLDGYWARAAYLARDEQLLGRLSPGYAADFVCLSQDPFQSRRLSDITVEATFVGGRCVYPADD